MWEQARDLLLQAERIQRSFLDAVTATHGLGPQHSPVGAPPRLPVNVFETEDAIHVTVAIPGVARSDVDLRIEHGGLLISCRRSPPCAPTEGVIRVLEIPFGRFERRVSLPDPSGFDVGEVELRDGLLNVTLRRRP